MKKAKKIIPAIVLSIVMLLLALTACGDTTPTTPPDQYTPAPETDISAEGTDIKVFVNGTIVPDAFPMSINLEEPNMPTHVALMPILRVLNAGVTSLDGEVTVEGINGQITFSINSETYIVNGEVITLPNLPSFMVNGTIYVPIRFFRDVFGMNNAYFAGGTVQINNEERME